MSAKVSTKNADRPSLLVEAYKSQAAALTRIKAGEGYRTDERETPSYLQRKASTRLSLLTDMVRSFPEQDDESIRGSVSIGLDEISKLQNLLDTELPGISAITIPSHLSAMLKPRKTLVQIQADLNASLSSSSFESREIEMKFKRQRVYDFVRKMALKKLEADIFRKLNIIYNNHGTDMEQTEALLPSFPIFGWTLEDFLERRRDRSISWIDTLLNLGPKNLEMLKFKHDMKELCKLLKLAFHTLRPSSNEAKQEVFTYIHDAYEYLKFPKVFKIEAKRNMDKLHDQVNTYLDMWIYKRGADEEAYKRSLEQRMMDLSVIGPIELRYEVNWMRTKTDQAVMRMTNALEEIEKKAENYRSEESKESYCARCALDMYYLDIENFKKRITMLSAQFDNEFEKAENEISYKKISMDKLKAQRKYLEEQMVRFSDEIEALHQKEIEEQEAAELKRLEELRALEEEASKKKKGGKGKGKGKK